ncbi:protein transport protein HofC [Pantoea coffeiphila]|uniref:Type IV pilin biogenesis protein n=1 Tax=Pantoea coffeiphila TaxID=1465635 RepID=A0A2S9I4U6_9GAMM|nr:protein transport protein HofC [Pantoea coffeiphila]PRD12823.1 type IV pilin biogenesis protein [Pantoea coffeiphila]
MSKRYLFRWQAIDDNGAIHSGCGFAPDSARIVDEIVGMKQLPLKISRGRRYRAGDWRWQHKIAFIRQLATLLKAGMPLVSGLQLLAEGHPDSGWRALLLHLQEKITHGEPFSSALREWPEVFSPLYPALIHIGELTGELDECCLRLAQQQERQQLLQQKVKKALRYPLFILAVALLVSIGMLIFVLPEFVAIYKTFDAPLPAFTAVVITFSEWLQHQAPLLIVPVIAASMFYRRQRKNIPNWQRVEQRLLLKTPLLSPLYRGSQLSQIYTTLALTQHAGLTLLQSLQAVEKTVSALLWQEAIVKLQQHIAAGNPLHQALKPHSLFTPLCYQLIKVGEESGSLDAMLTRLASWHEAETHQLADTLAAALEPMMMVVIGIIVGTLVVAMYLPVFRLGDALG